jgi:hypothetical protein
MPDPAQPRLWRVFLPLAPYALFFLLTYAVLRPLGLGWAAAVVTLGAAALVLVYVRMNRRR